MKGQGHHSHGRDHPGLCLQQSHRHDIRRSLRHVYENFEGGSQRFHELLALPAFGDSAHLYISGPSSSALDNHTDLLLGGLVTNESLYLRLADD